MSIPLVVGVTCEIRVLATIEELVESYALRYEVYSALGYLLQSNRSGLEIDAFDACSVPFGAFHPDSGALLGTLRFITGSKQPAYVRAIDCILSARADPELAEQASRQGTKTLPSIVSEEVARQVDVFNTDRFPVGELSRSIVGAAHRGLGIARALIEFGVAYAARSGPMVLVGGCLPEHLPLYARFGFHRTPETSLDRYASVGQVANAVIGRTDVLPEPARMHVEELVRHMRAGAATCVLGLSHGMHAVHHCRQLELIQEGD